MRPLPVDPGGRDKGALLHHLAVRGGEIPPPACRIEGDAGVGAIYIPGTPTGSDATSWMQACGPADDFNNNDKVALDALY